jgi:iron complex transport system substrate-binding protein
VLAARGSGPGSPQSAASSSATAAAAAYPVTISNCGTSVTYTKAPARAVSNDINTTEDMIALGLESHMAGEFGASGSLPSGQPFPAQFAAGFKQVHEISPDYFTLEQLIGHSSTGEFWQMVFPRLRAIQARSWGE